MSSCVSNTNMSLVGLKTKPDAADKHPSALLLSDPEYSMIRSSLTAAKAAVVGVVSSSTRSREHHSRDTYQPAGSVHCRVQRLSG